MGSIYKKKTKKPIPTGAEITKFRGKPVAVWTGGGNRKYRAALTEDGQKIVTDSANWYITYINENGVRIVENSKAKAAGISE